MNVPQLREQIEVLSAQIVALLMAVDRGRVETTERVRKTQPETAGARTFEGIEREMAMREALHLRIERVKAEAALGILIAACEKRDHEPQQVNGEWVCSNCGAPCPQIGQDSAQEALSL